MKKVTVIRKDILMLPIGCTTQIGQMRRIFLFAKCNNPNTMYNYDLEVTVIGEVDQSGYLIDMKTLSDLIKGVLINLI